MKLALSFVVASCVAQPFAARASVGGKEMDVTIEGLVVELVSEDGSMSQTLRLTPDDLDAAREAYAVGATVTATYNVSTK